ncbi:response regulator transcription factor [Aquibium carbonis]|uniref:Response regulator transcription factor n=1 Tax=Aquibium carbonis TaxID=2495581 RepID=A0A3R9Y7T8_9HYPH|nr:response regulator transcription factor [Aquibium carbonis]RST86066.1 response regulator transcription factor [Aquibium carbonis]
MTRKITVIVVDDHPLYRSGVVRTLEDDGGFDVVAEGSDAANAVQLAMLHKPDLIILDISMPGSGLEAAKRIAEVVPRTRIAMLTVSEADDDIVRALDLGAAGYIQKGIGGPELVRVARGIAAGQSYVAPGLAARLLVGMRTRTNGGPANTELTAREEQILRLVAKGLSNKEVGRSLNLQEKTVKHYMTNILQKLQVRNRVEATIKAAEMWGRVG